MIGEGKPLHHIPDLRRLFNLTGDTPLTEESHDRRRQPDGHVVAVRLTSEDTSKGFEPTSGTVRELSFQGTPHAYGYFSVKIGSTIHELADSQASQSNVIETIEFSVVIIHGMKMTCSRHRECPVKY